MLEKIKIKGPHIHLKVGSELGQEADGGPVLEVAVQVLLEAGLDQGRKVGHHPWRDGNLRQHVHLAKEKQNLQALYFGKIRIKKKHRSSGMQCM